MKKIDKLWGYLNIDKTALPFYFDTESFELLVFPENGKCGFMDLDVISAFFKNFGDPRDHKWIRRIRLSGITSEGYRIIFDSGENFNTYNGSRVFSVNWVYYYDFDRDINAIDGFNVDGTDVERFYSPTKAFKSDEWFDKKTGALSGFNFKTVEPVEADGGSFELHWNDIPLAGTMSDDPMCNDDPVANNEEEEDSRIGIGEGNATDKRTNVNIKLTAYANVRPLANTPLIGTSDIEFNYDSPVSLNAVIKNYKLVRNFFQYILYCSSVNFNNLETYWFDAEKRKRYNGRLIWRPSTSQKVNEELYLLNTGNDKKYIIEFDLLKDKTAKLFEIIDSNLLTFDHLVSSVEARHSYPISRFIMILTAFEREYRNIYGTDSLRDDQYKNFKTSFIQALNNKRETLHGKERKWIKDFIRGMENSDDSYTDRVRNALILNRDEIEPFIKTHYRYTDYHDFASDISERIGGLRNAFAHNRFDLKFEPENLSDIKVIEEMLYCIRLKSIGLGTHRIQQAVSELMGENLFFTEVATK